MAAARKHLYKLIANKNSKIEDFVKFVEMNSDYPEAYISLAREYVKYKDFSSAVDVYEDALKKFPAYSKIHANYLVCLNQMGEHEKEIRVANLVLEMDPASLNYRFLAQIYCGLAIAYERINDLGSSGKMAKKATQVDPTYAAAWSTLAKGTKDKYLRDQYYEKARQLDHQRFEENHPTEHEKYLAKHPNTIRGAAIKPVILPVKTTVVSPSIETIAVIEPPIRKPYAPKPAPKWESATRVVRRKMIPTEVAVHESENPFAAVEVEEPKFQRQAIVLQPRLIQVAPAPETKLVVSRRKEPSVCEVTQKKLSVLFGQVKQGGASLLTQLGVFSGAVLDLPDTVCHAAYDAYKTCKRNAKRREIGEFIKKDLARQPKR